MRLATWAATRCGSGFSKLRRNCWIGSGQDANSVTKIKVVSLCIEADIKVKLVSISIGADRKICIVNPAEAPDEFWTAYKP